MSYDPTRTAIHEAGHLVISRLCGWPMAGLRITINPEYGQPGPRVWGSVSWKAVDDRIHYNPDAPVPREDVPAAVSLAGKVAEARDRGERFDPAEFLAGGSSDARQVREALEGREHRLGAIAAAVGRAVDANFAAIESLARYLEQYGELDGAEAVRIIDRALAFDAALARLRAG